MTLALGWLWRGSVLGLIAFAIFGPLANLLLWAFAIQWYYPHKLPLSYGFRYWGEVFKPTSDAFASLGTSVLIATITVILCLLLAIPAGSAVAGIVGMFLAVPAIGVLATTWGTVLRVFGSEPPDHAGEDDGEGRGAAGDPESAGDTAPRGPTGDTAEAPLPIA